MTQTWRFRAIVPGALSFSLLAAVSVLPVALSQPARAGDAVFDATSDDFSGVVDHAKAAVVQVRSGSKFILAGSGFFIDDSGTILTSSTILGDNKTARVLINGIEMEAKILGNDPRSGLAMLRVSYDESPFVPLGHTSDIKTGNNLLMLGYPMNLPVASAEGPVSGFDISYLARVDGDVKKEAPGTKTIAAVERFATTHMHINVPISPGQVGGPVLNSRGEVVGIIATSPDGGRSIYALPAEAISKIVSDFNQYGHAKHGWVGVNVTEAPDTNHDGRTVRVVQAVPGTPAAQSGIAPGDIVLRIDSREIYRPGDVLDASFFSHVGGNMTVVVRRDDKLIDYTFAVIERPETPPSPVSTSAARTTLLLPAHPTSTMHVVADVR